MKFSQMIAWTLLLSGPLCLPGQAQKAVESHRDYLVALRKAVQQPVGSQELYLQVIKPEFLTTLRDAAGEGNEALALELLQSYSGPESIGKGGTALTWAAWYGDEATVKSLLAHSPKVNATDDGGRTALHQAADMSRPYLVKLLLENGADVEAKTKEGITSLMLAAGEKFPDNVQLLLAKGAEVNTQNKQGETALMRAARNGRLANVKLLLSEGANVQLKDKKGQTALDIARKSPGAPWQSFRDSPGMLSVQYAKELEAQAKRDQATIIQVLTKAGGQ